MIPLSTMFPRCSRDRQVAGGENNKESLFCCFKDIARVRVVVSLMPGFTHSMYTE